MYFESILRLPKEELAVYLTPEKIKEYGFNERQLAELIKATGEIEKYLTPEILSMEILSSWQVVELIKMTGHVEQYITKEMVKVAKLNGSEITSLIKEAGKTEEFLSSPERLVEFGLNSYISDLIGQTGNIEAYLLKGQTVKDKNSLSMLNVLKKLGPEKIEEYLADTERLHSIGIDSSHNIVKLIKEVENEGDYITKEKREEYGLDIHDMMDIIVSSGKKIAEYLTPEKI